MKNLDENGRRKMRKYNKKEKYLQVRTVNNYNQVKSQFSVGAQ